MNIQNFDKEVDIAKKELLYIHCDGSVVALSLPMKSQVYMYIVHVECMCVLYSVHVHVSHLE